MKKTIHYSVLVFLFFLFTHAYSQETRNVGPFQPYNTIADAIADANKGDTINIIADTLKEVLVNVTKSVIIQGQGAFNTVIWGTTTDPATPKGRIFTIKSSLEVVIQDVTIANGYA
jgi:hypothetical protein